MGKFWFEVEISEDAETTSGEPIKPGATGRCFSGYLE